MRRVLNKASEVERVVGLFEQELDMFNIGLDGFAEELAEQGVAVTQLDWRPPAGGDAELAHILSILGS